jgi:hypothetical protein
VVCNLLLFYRLNQHSYLLLLSLLEVPSGLVFKIFKKKRRRKKAGTGFEGNGFAKKYPAKRKGHSRHMRHCATITGKGHALKTNAVVSCFIHLPPPATVNCFTHPCFYRDAPNVYNYYIPNWLLTRHIILIAPHHGRSTG